LAIQKGENGRNDFQRDSGVGKCEVEEAKARKGFR